MSYSLEEVIKSRSFEGNHIVAAYEPKSDEECYIVGVIFEILTKYTSFDYRLFINFVNATGGPAELVFTVLQDLIQHRCLILKEHFHIFMSSDSFELVDKTQNTEVLVEDVADTTGLLEVYDEFIKCYPTYEDLMKDQSDEPS